MGVAGTILNFLNKDSWSLVNLDTDEVIEGQFHAENLTENIGSKFETHTSFSRQTPYTQFINGDAVTFSFDARLFSDGDLLSRVNLGSSFSDAGKFATLPERLNILKKWAKVGDKGRPALLSFSIGDGSEVSLAQCVITSLGGISYERPKSTGGMRDVTLKISLLEYNDFQLEEDNLAETRYHNVAENEYYELLTLREYGDPALGDIIRKRHPQQPNLQVGDTVKLPDYSAIQTDKVKQTSIALKGAWSRKESAQKTLRLSVLDRLNRDYFSHIIQEE